MSALQFSPEFVFDDITNTKARRFFPYSVFSLLSSQVTCETVLTFICSTLENLFRQFCSFTNVEFTVCKLQRTHAAFTLVFLRNHFLVATFLVFCNTQSLHTYDGRRSRQTCAHKAATSRTDGRASSLRITILYRKLWQLATAVPPTVWRRQGHKNAPQSLPSTQLATTSCKRKILH